MKMNDKHCRMAVLVLIVMLMASGVFVNATVGGNKKVLMDGKVGYSDIHKNFVSIEVNAETYDIKKTEQGHNIFVENFGRLLIPGKPNLPSKIFSVAIPPGSKVVEVTFDAGEGVIFPDIYEIPPSPLPRVTGQEDTFIYGQEKQIYNENYDLTYLNDDPYPSSVVEFVRTAGYRKYNLVDVRVTPFTYQPLSGRLIYFPDITIDVRYSFPADFSFGNIMTNNLPRSERIAEQIIFNYDQAKKWYPIGTTDENRGTHDFVIITLDSLVSSVSSLVDWETDKGRNVNVVTISWINSNYGGYDLAEKMRNFLRDKYPSDEWGIEDVLLVGHYDDVPMRRTAQDEGYGEPETDFYYAELSLPDDQSWDANENHQYGEYSDPIDFYSEVNVGRMPWSDPTTVSSICEKSVAYEQNNDTSFKKNILLLGAFFWDDTDNAVLMETKVDQPWMSDWTMTRMYEQGHSTYSMDYDLKNSNVVSVWSSGKFAFVNWAGHGSPAASYIKYSTGEAFISSFSCSSLNDEYPAIIFADACSNSDTDYLNIGQAMLKQGGVGFLGATKVAYGTHAWNSPYDGSSQSLDYFFTTCVTSGDYTQGEAHQWALREMYTGGLWSNNYYETFEWGALWGNPNLGMAPVILHDLPEISNVQASPQLQETNGWVNISCDVTAGAGVNLVKANITYSGSSNVNQTMINIPGTDTFYYNSTYSVSGLYDFFIWADDNPGNSNVSEDYTFKIGIPPDITQIEATPYVQDTPGWVNLTCMVTDNGWVDTVLVNITYPDSTIHSFPMNRIGGTDNHYYNATYSLEGSYSFFIWVDDNLGNSNTSDVHYFHIGVVAVDIPLTTGWNLITIPVENSYWASTLGENITGCTQISYWNNSAGEYDEWYPGFPIPENDYPILDGRGYFVYVTEDSMFSVSGSPITDVSVDLDIGWNMIGWFKEDSTMASSLGENITGCTQISYWNNSAGEYDEWYPGFPIPENDYPICMGMGLFVYVDQASIWHGEG